MTSKARRHGFTITARDLEMLWSLSQARFLTAESLEWLHVPHWPARRQRWLERRTAGKQELYRPSTALYNRLHRLEHAGLVLRIRRPISIAVNVFSRMPDLYGLSEMGAKLLAEYRGIDLQAIHFERQQQRSFLMLAHTADIGRVYAALRAKIEATAGLAFVEWQGDYLSAKDYDRIDVPSSPMRGSRTESKLPIQPDGAFKLLHGGGAVQCFVEVDRGRPVNTWIDKIRAYHAYEGSSELHGRYGVASFVLLTFTNSTTQQQKLMEATALVLGQPIERYLFCLIDDAHPLTVGKHWHKLVKVTPTQRQFPTSAYVPDVVIETAPHTFIR